MKSFYIKMQSTAARQGGNLENVKACKMYIMQDLYILLISAIIINLAPMTCSITPIIPPPVYQLSGLINVHVTPPPLKQLSNDHRLTQ